MLIRFLSIILLMSVATGCALKNYKAQTYVMTKPRVGVEKGNGNAGYLSGTPQFVEPARKTRQVYVLEITKSLPEEEVKKIEEEITQATSTKIDTTVHVPEAQNQGIVTTATERKITIPRIDDEPSTTEKRTPTGPSEDMTYTVLKDDTLQKIAKKYYGSYGAWLKIYNANKEKIKNPNLVKPGTVLTLPAVK